MNGGFQKRHGQKVDAKVGRYNFIEVCTHALEQMKIRSVRMDQVVDVLQSPDEVDLPTQAGRKRYRKSISTHRWADVVFEEASDRLVVITVISIQKEKPRPLRKRRGPI